MNMVVPVTTKKRTSPLVFCAFDTEQKVARRVTTHDAYGAVRATLGEDYMPFTHSVERWIA
jgi:hypothetical protein